MCVLESESSYLPSANNVFSSELVWKDFSWDLRKNIVGMFVNYVPMCLCVELNHDWMGGNRREEKRRRGRRRRSRRRRRRGNISQPKAYCNSFRIEVSSCMDKKFLDNQNRSWGREREDKEEKEEGYCTYVRTYE